MRKALYFLLFLLLSLSATAQKKHSISGYVTDAASRETLIGATVYDRNSGHGCATNNYGYYSLTLDEGTIDLQFSFVGYNTENQRFQLLSDTLINVGLNTNLQLQDYTTITSGNNYSQYYSEPVGVYSNVENGFGLVAGSNDKMIGFPVW